MATQSYNKNVPFNTYTWDQISSEWKWDGRTLSAYYTDLSGWLTIGQELICYDDNTYISGMWTMDNTTLPMRIHLLGESGQVSVIITEKNIGAPLGNASNPFWKTYDAITESKTFSDFHRTTTGTEASQIGLLSIEIIPREGTTINSIKFGGNIKTIGEQITCQGWEQWYKNDNTLCVDFTEGGYLHYIKNDTYVNPSLRD